MNLRTAQDFDNIAMSLGDKKYSVRREMRVPHVDVTPQTLSSREMPKVKQLVDMKERYYQPSSKMSEGMVHHILHPEDDDTSVDEEHKHIPLDLGTKTLQRIIDQMKTLMTIPHSEPTQADALAAGMPRYCNYLNGEKCHEPTHQTLEQILSGSN